jgi:hypothetical protein
MSTYPAFTSLEEVLGFLNATGPDNNSNYTVYGLLISAESVQSRVDHANKYVSSLVPSLLEGTVDSRLASAELAALNLACLGVLVTVVGGSLVGAYDYFLGDMRVARSSPYASAIKAAMAGFQADARANMANLTLGVAFANAKLGRIR